MMLLATEVTAIPQRMLLTLGVLALAVLAGMAMKAGWNRKLAAQANLPQPPTVPESFSGQALDGRYIGSTLAGDWLARVAVHDLGVPSLGRLEWNATGVAIRRTGAADVFINAAELLEVRSDRGIAGRAYEKDGLIVLRWRLGETEIETGFRASSTADQVRFLDAFPAGAN